MTLSEVKFELTYPYIDCCVQRLLDLLFAQSNQLKTTECFYELKFEII